MLEAAEIYTSSSSGTWADYRTPPQKQGERAKKEGDCSANNMVFMWANWQIKMTRCHVELVDGKQLQLIVIVVTFLGL